MSERFCATDSAQEIGSNSVICPYMLMKIGFKFSLFFKVSKQTGAKGLFGYLIYLGLGGGHS